MDREQIRSITFQAVRYIDKEPVEITHYAQIDGIGWNAMEFLNKQVPIAMVIVEIFNLKVLDVGHQFITLKMSSV